MTRYQWLYALTAVGGLTIGAGTRGDEPARKSPPDARAAVTAAAKEGKELARGCNEFAFDLFRKQAGDDPEKPGNVVVAPYGVAETLGLAYAGARGQTADDIAKVLRLKVKPEQIGPAFAALGVGGGGHLAGEPAAAKPRFGARIQEVAGGGVEVTEVLSGSPADTAGLRPKDRIVRLGNWSVRSATEYANALDTFVDQLEGEVRDAKGLRQFTAKLNPPTPGTNRVRPQVASAVWARRGLEFVPEFRTTADTYFGAAAESVDFAGDPKAARARINRWVAEATDDNIRNLLPPAAVTADTAVVLTSALHFEANWRSPFNPKFTAAGTFRGPGKKELSVSMMYKKWTFRYVKTDKGVEMIDLPLEGDFALTLLLPSEGSDGLADLEKGLTADTLAALDRAKPVLVKLTVPKFAVATETDLRSALSALGMASAFGEKADFSGMTRPQSLALGRVSHKAEVEIHERGIRATAGTAGTLEPLERAAAEFRADRPFLFVVRDSRSGVILFVGRVVSPPEAE